MKKMKESLLDMGWYMHHGSLRSLFDNIPDVPWALRFQILHQVALGMNYLHTLDPPIIHRDLKPCNVLLNKHLDVQITDFGLSKIVGATSSVTPSFAGTWSYMAPEALYDINYRPTKSYDVYSYGILTWTVFSGEEPYPGVPAVVVQHCVSKGQRPRVSDLDQYRDVKMVSEAKELMIRCWNQNPENRPSFHDCGKLTAEMFKAYQDEVVNAVRRVQDLLNEISSQDQEPSFDASPVSSGPSENIDNFIRDLGNAENGNEDIEESRPVAKGPKHEVHENGTTALALPPEAEINSVSTEDSPMNNIEKFIKNTGKTINKHTMNLMDSVKKLQNVGKSFVPRDFNERKHK